MTKWLEQNKNTVLIIVLALFVLLTLLFFFLIRPLAAEEEAKEQELNRIDTDISFYQDHLNTLAPQTFTEEEKEPLLGAVPSTPNVEEVVKDLERTEIETGAVIDNVAISIQPNEQGQTEATTVENGETQAEGTSEGTNAETSTPPAQQQGTSSWSHILPEETLKLLEEKERFKDVSNLTVSYVEFVIDFNGELKDVDQFIEKLENFQRITHIQSYDYSINEENGRLEGIVTIRTFYSNDFEELMNEESHFELDYDFAPSKIKRYIEPESTESESSNITNEIPTHPQVEGGTGSVSVGEENNNNTIVEPPSDTKPDEKSDNHNKTQNPIDPNYKVYNAPQTKRDGEPVFLVVQTGAYKYSNNLNTAVKELVDIGVYPRVVGDQLFYVYTATDSSTDSAQKIVDMLNSKGFDSYVKTLPYRLNYDEKTMLLKEADALVSTTTEILTSGITKNDASIEEAQLKIVRDKMNIYGDKVQELMKKNIDETRKQELQESLSILSELEKVLQNSVKEGKRESLWEAEGLLLDFMLILNRYVPADLNK